ncbi:UDP-N-acetylglucosamine transferase subunit ALG13 homolog isoform X2 [Eurytemora carolleeae]|uniref:UDP-N-acetylglucosamine transferase subunit ALG13 homolog isoform X2 n=1 Tax=Eurytemora carolleeae TaxID=1294199 RepID=UPI000C77D992|nr:UDP-N-acetylglucosamine transferase subunit ALG13 homolog isoform X2 [Eurytemora carolleeae]|eukprot:XP_023322724.1 UDP-N-acetylglucosamine transferase subunit ALG13 homolog isoform X2 [Eurytemora affinis]
MKYKELYKAKATPQLIYKLEDISAMLNLVSLKLQHLIISIVPDMMKADLIISHAGAGTCLEALELKKDLVAVVNDSLMGNHQVELAEKLASEGYCDYATLSSLNSVLSNIKTKKKIIFPRQDDSLLSDFLRHRLEMD